MKLSLCMIVKNEEKVLERVLSKAKDFADEIIIVDTGSKDATKYIASKFTDKIYDFEWCDDFAQARNFSFSKATCEYIIWLDADDVITEENIKKIVDLKKSPPQYDIYMFRYQMGFDENDQPTFEYYRERILKNNKRYVWRGWVHEAIALQGKVGYFDIAIEHRKIETTRDSGRNLKIYQKHIAKGETLDPRAQFYYSRELYFNNQIDQAISSFSKFITDGKGYLPNIIDAQLTLSKCYVLKNDLNSAKNILIDSMKFSPPNGEICCALGEIYQKQNDISSAIFWYTTSTICPINMEKGGFVQKDFYDFIPYIQLSCLYYRIGNKDKFAEYHRKAKALKPTHPNITKNEKFL